MLKQFISKYSDELKTIFYGLLYIVFAIVFWWHIAGNPIDELALIQNAKLTTCRLVETYEVENEDNRGNVHISDVAVYNFTLPDGREFKTFTENFTGFEEEQVEYLPDNPSVNRIKGDGCQSIMEWLWRKIVIGGLLLIMFISPGIVLIRKEIINIQKKDERLLLKEYIEKLKIK